MQLLSRKNFSAIHLRGAIRLAGSVAYELDQPDDTPRRGTRIVALDAAVASTIIAATAFLEAAINELFADAADTMKQIPELSAEARQTLAESWASGVPRTASFPVLSKYQIGRLLLKLPPADSGASPAQGVSWIVKLRNALIHFEPDWKTHTIGKRQESNPDDKFELALKGRFPESSLLASSGNPFFPDRIFGYGCAHWAVSKSAAFADEFFSLAGIAKGYQEEASALPPPREAT